MPSYTWICSRCKSKKFLYFSVNLVNDSPIHMFEKAMLGVNFFLQQIFHSPRLWSVKTLVELRYLYTAIRSASTSTDKRWEKNVTFHKAVSISNSWGEGNEIGLVPLDSHDEWHHFSLTPWPRSVLRNSTQLQRMSLTIDGCCCPWNGRAKAVGNSLGFGILQT